MKVGLAFNVFDWIQPKESDLSDILRDLLDPQGSHGQGGIFLRLALDELFKLSSAAKHTEFSRSVVIREAPTYEGRRIDILIDPGTRLGSIAIENKPWAEEGEDQLEDYANYLRQRHSEQSFCLIFLHGPDSEPKSLKPETRRMLESQTCFQTIPYYSSSGTSLHQWIVRCAEICQAEPVRWFLRDFASYVADEFPPVEKDAE